MRKSAAAVLLLLAGGVLDVRAQQPASDVELKAAYCLGVGQASVAAAQQMVAKEGDDTGVMREYIGRKQSDLERLRGYLVPKIPYLDSAGPMVAINRGIKDRQTGLAHTNICMNKCVQPSTTREQFLSCHTACLADEPAIARTTSCDRMDWLPF